MIYLNMAKQLALSDLTTALKPIVEALSRLRDDLNTYSTQISEMHAMVTNISVKIDTLEQTTGATLSEVSKPVVKKPSTRKPAARKAPVKAPTKRGTKANADEAADEDAETADEDAAEDVEEEQVEEETPKKAAIKTAVKAPVKKQTVARLNKMTLFMSVYKSEPAKFDKYLTSKVKKAIQAKNEKWKEMTEEQVTNAQRKEYYHYMKDNHDDVLEALKVEHADPDEA